MRPPCLIHLSTSNEASPRERSDRGRFCLFIPGCVQGAIIKLVRLCVTFVVFTDCGSYTRICGSGRAWANARDAFRRGLSRGGRGRWTDVGFAVCFRWGGNFFRIFFFDFFFFERTRPVQA